MKKILATLTAAAVIATGALAVPTAASAYGSTYAAFIKSDGNHSVNHRADMDAQKTAHTFLNHETAVYADGEMSTTSPGALGYAGQVKNINPLVYLPLSGNTPSRQPLLGDKTVMCPPKELCIKKVESTVSVPNGYNIEVAYSKDSTMVNPIIEARVKGETPDKIMPMRTLTRVHFVDGSKLNVWTDTFIAPYGATFYEPYPADRSYPSIYSVNITATRGKEKNNSTYMLPVPEGVKHETRELGTDQDYFGVHSDDANLETELNRLSDNQPEIKTNPATKPPYEVDLAPTDKLDMDGDCLVPVGGDSCASSEVPAVEDSPSTGKTKPDTIGETNHEPSTTGNTTTPSKSAKPSTADTPGGFPNTTPGENQKSSPDGSSENSKLGEIVVTIAAVIAALGGIAGLAWWAYQNRPNK